MSAIHALSLISDLILLVQMEDAVRHLGFLMGAVSTPEKAISALRQGRDSLFIIDLVAAGGRVAKVLQAAKAAPYPVAVLAFGPDDDLEAQQAARDGGADLVVSRRQFHQEMAALMIDCLNKHRSSETKVREKK